MPRTPLRSRAFEGGPADLLVPCEQDELGWLGCAIETRWTTTDALASKLLARAVPPLAALVDLPRGSYIIGEPGEKRAVALERVLFGRWPVVNAQLGLDG